MSYNQGKTSSSGTSTTSPTISGTQSQYLGNQAQLGTQAANALGSTLGSATDLYNQSAGGVTNAATDVAQTGNALSQNMGQGGANAYQTGINALSNISSPAYQQAEINAAMIPAEQQYAQNLAAQGAGFGGAGQIGSSRQALAGQQLAGQNELNQQQAAATVLNNLTNQQITAGQGLTSAGISGGQLGLQGAQAGLTASQAPMSYLQQLANLYGGVAGTSQANPNFAGTAATTTSTGQTGNTSNAGVSL
jgi:hypothetical protein